MLHSTIASTLTELLHDSISTKEPTEEKQRERLKRKATAPNSLSTLAPQEDSKSQKKKKQAKYRG